MSSQPTLFGAYPWARTVSAPTLFGEGFVPSLITLTLAESMSEVDSDIFQTVKVLTDFLTLKEWISIQHTKAIVWTNASVNANLHDTLWGKYQFGSQLFGGVKPVSTWNKGVKGAIPWTNTDGSKYNC